MAEEASAPVAVDAPKPVEEQTRPVEAADNAVAAEAKPEGSGDVAPADAPAEEQAPKTAAATDDQVAKDESTDAKPDTTAAESSGDAAAVGEVSTEAAATNGTPASGKKANRRKSIPEHHKGKKTPKKGKKAPELHLDTVPGDMWMVAMRGYQPWPVVICDEDMLPESLISKRPVSAKRIDGTYRDDFLDNGKNVKDRRYPVMFLSTNEFAWQVNTELLPFNIDEVKKEVEAGNNAKKNKNLWDAYVIAAEGHDLAWFKQMLLEHEQAIIDDAEAKAAKKEEKAKKAEKAAKRKSAAAVESEDVEMEDAGEDAAPSAKKGSKKRKKDDDSDGETEKPAKTPKTKLKLNNKPKDASAAKSKEKAKSKKAKSSEDEAEAAPTEEPPLTEAERLQKREKSVLYLRHRLQKGFLSREQAPKDEDMSTMSDYLKQLEQLEDLEADVIKNTKVHKVLKAIIKLSNIPQEEHFKFKERSNNLLTKWSGALSTEGEQAADAPASAVPTTNGVKHDEEKKVDAPEPAEKAEKIEETTTASETAKPSDVEGDVSMADAKDEAPAVKPDAAPMTESVAETTAPETAAA